MTRIPSRLVVIIAVVLSALGSSAFPAQDKYTVKTPNGLDFSAFRGYENWQVVAVSQTDELLKVEVANPVMIEAYRAGIPGNGKPFPDGSKIAKIEWRPKKSTEAPFSVNIPDTQKDVDFIEKDSKRFSDTHGWAYAEFAYDAASDTFAPTQKDAKCGAACHEIAAAKDYIFTVYQHR
ncbi:MAG TPA: cytochrome P460 family protein [Aliidongia sp.]|nr:cytochrome P460 family protein [Aliidongia sp.]